MPSDSRAELEQAFPGLKGTHYTITSPRDGRHNCIGFAAGDHANWWWPIEGRFWPEGVPREVTVAAFEQAFRLLGYEPCPDGTLEPDKDKVVLYVDEDGAPQHMARQRQRMWHSKLGDRSDIIHELRALEGMTYGVVHAFFSRISQRKRDKNRSKEQRKHAHRK